MKSFALNSYIYPSYYYRPSADIIKWPILKSPYFHSHASQFTKHLSFVTIEGDTHIQLQNGGMPFISSLCQYPSTYNIWPPYNRFKAEHHNISKFLLPPYTHPKYATSQENFEEFSRALRDNPIKYTTISSSKAPKFHVKLVTYMNNDNVFDLLIVVFSAISTQLGVLGTK